VTREKIIETLSLLKPEMEKRFHLEAIGILGSVARNSFTPESDIDLFVKIKDLSPLSALGIERFP
jgi:predicted nucleotidyltransferase